jgi:hypothetical protein
MTIQLDLFPQLTEAPTDFSHGLVVQLSDCCQCGSCDTVIGEGKGPHSASLFCSRCERHRGWIANEAHVFVTEVVKKFGKPTTPIKIRPQQSEGEQP